MADLFSKIFEPIVIPRLEDPFKRVDYQSIVVEPCFTSLGSTAQLLMWNTMLYNARGGAIRRVFETICPCPGLFGFYPCVYSVDEAMSVLNRCGAIRKYGLFVDTRTLLLL